MLKKIRYPKSLDGLNVKEGVERLDGDWALYINLVGFFCEDKKNFKEEILKLIEDKQYDVAMIKSHSLKGSSGTIAAFNVNVLAKKIEIACIDKNNEEIYKYLDLIEKALEEVSNSYNKLSNLGEITKEEPPKELLQDKTKLLKLLENLDEGLKNFDPVSAENCFKEIKEFFVSDVFENIIKEVKQQANAYNFDDARKLLDKLAFQLKTKK